MFDPATLVLADRIRRAAALLRAFALLEDAPVRPSSATRTLLRSPRNPRDPTRRDAPPDLTKPDATLHLTTRNAPLDLAPGDALLHLPKSDAPLDLATRDAPATRPSHTHRVALTAPRRPRRPGQPAPRPALCLTPVAGKPAGLRADALARSTAAAAQHHRAS